MAVVASSHAVVDPRAVVVAHSYAHAAEAAVFRPRGFLEVAGGADVLRIEEGVVEGIVPDSGVVVGWSDVVGSVRDAEPCEQERRN